MLNLSALSEIIFQMTLLSVASSGLTCAYIVTLLPMVRVVGFAEIVMPETRTPDAGIVTGVSATAVSVSTVTVALTFPVCSTYMLLLTIVAVLPVAVPILILSEFSVTFHATPSTGIVTEVPFFVALTVKVLPSWAMLAVSSVEGSIILTVTGLLLRVVLSFVAVA